MNRNQLLTINKKVNSHTNFCIPIVTLKKSKIKHRSCRHPFVNELTSDVSITKTILSDIRLLGETVFEVIVFNVDSVLIYKVLHSIP